MVKAITLCEIADEDFKTQVALGYKNIPANTEVEIVGKFSNFYGDYTKVKYNNIVYYTKAENLKKI